jgi:hypothetical protein
MNKCPVTNTHIVSDGGSALLVGTVKNSAILNIYLVANPDKIHIAPHNCLKPYRALVAHHYITNDGGVFRQKAVFSELRCYFTTGNYQRHNDSFDCLFFD